MSSGSEGAAGTPNVVSEALGDAVEIVYRGQPRIAQRVGEQLIIEGDIVVGPKDLEPVDNGGLTEKGVRISGPRGTAYYQWNIGVVPYTFDASVSAAQRRLFIAAANMVAGAAPGLVFAPRVAETDYVTFRIFVAPGLCGQSPVGRQGGQQFVDLTAGCLAGFSTQHEIMHMLGMFHEQSRTDVTSNITTNWANIQGCADGATSSANCGSAACSANPLICECPTPFASSCDMSGQFVVPSTAANLGSYDYDSLMHYGAFAFAKCNNAAGATVLCSTVGASLRQTLTPPAGTPAIGQRTRLSEIDKLSLAAMYPALTLHSPIFANTGSARLCRLAGRDADANTWFAMDFAWPTPVTPGTFSDDGMIDTSLVGEGDYSVACTAASAFWMNTYAYPAATRTVDPSTVGIQEGYVNLPITTLRVLNPGLIAVLFGS